MNGNIWFILKILPYLGACSLIAGFVGWYLHHKFVQQLGSHAEPVNHSKDDQVRLKKMQEKLHKSEALNHSLTNELNAIRTASVNKADHEAAAQLLAETKKSVDLERQRAATLEADLKKAQETISAFHSKANAAVKDEKSRIFLLENELSKTRAELLGLQGKGDDSTELRKELERMRESVANATRFAGEARKREAALAEELEAGKAKWEKLSAVGTPVISTPAPLPTFASAMPAVVSDNVAKARAEVARLNEERKQKQMEEAAQLAASPAAAPAVVVAADVPADVVVEDVVAEKVVIEEFVAEKVVTDVVVVEDVAAEEVPTVIEGGREV
jgi:AraC-like DNA-binding protein